MLIKILGKKKTSFLIFNNKSTTNVIWLMDLKRKWKTKTLVFCFRFQKRSEIEMRLIYLPD